MLSMLPAPPPPSSVVRSADRGLRAARGVRRGRRRRARARRNPRAVTRCWWRKDSRARRLSLLRSTARFAARRETVKPSRATARPLERARTVKKRSLERAGSANTRPNSAGECSRWSGENPAVSGSNAAPKRNPLRREASAALRASTRENFSAGAGGHAGAKTMRAFAMQVAGLKGSLHARVPRAGKSSCENKDVGRPGSRALYAAHRAAVNRDAAGAQRCAQRSRIAVEVVDNCAAGAIRLAAHSLAFTSTNFFRAPVAENSAVYSSLWMQCARALEAELSEQQFNTWIRPLQLVEDGGLLKLLAPNRFVVDWVKTHCLEQIRAWWTRHGDGAPRDSSRGRQSGPLRGAMRRLAEPEARAARCDAARCAAQQDFHVRQLRRGQEQPARSRRGGSGGPESRQRVQPAVHLRRRRPRQDPPHACDR